ncbi:MAG TPA: hypothetical protein VIL55_16225 [Naasia sp.]
MTYAEKSLLLGDEAADTLTSYAAVLGNFGGADDVTVAALGVDGEEVSATFILNSGTVLMAESTKSRLPEPDNADVVAYMRARIGELDSRRAVVPDDPAELMPDMDLL